MDALISFIGPTSPTLSLVSCACMRRCRFGMALVGPSWVILRDAGDSHRMAGGVGSEGPDRASLEPLLGHISSRSAAVRRYTLQAGCLHLKTRAFLERTGRLKSLSLSVFPAGPCRPLNCLILHFAGKERNHHSVFSQSHLLTANWSPAPWLYSE